MLTKILIGLAVIIVVFIIIASLQRSEYRISRSITVAAPAAEVFPQVNDLHNYEVWNPWGKYDASMKTTFEGPRAGVGAGLNWTGNNQVGQGRMIITDSRPNELISMQLEFIKPFPSTATAEFTFTPEGDGTTITWTMLGERTFVPKAVGLFMNMDRMIGGEFEKGLTEMKSIVEGTGKIARQP